MEDGRIALTDDVRGFIPELPDYGQTITVDHLLTHTSGIRDWVWLSQATGGRDDVLTLILRQRGIDFAPGEAWSYSNSGYELLREIVTRVSGQPLAEFMRTRLFEPLGMRSTRYAREGGEVGNRALAYEKAGDGWRQEMLAGNARGGGGVFSTAADLVTWNDALTASRLGADVSAKLQEPARLANGRTLSYARGLILDAEGDREIVWHSGSAAAYKAMVARLPRQGVSLAVLCNAGEAASRQASERRIVDLFVPASAAAAAVDAARVTPPAAGAGAANAAAPDESSRAGLYFNEATGEPLRLVHDGGRLRIPGGPVLVTLGPNRFRNPRGTTSFMSEDEFELRFVSDDLFELISMEGRTTNFRRARPYVPTAIELEDFAGRYETDEVGVLEITPGTSGLSGSLNGSPPIELTPVDIDVFQRGAMTVRFRRDARGSVTALELSNPVVRNLRFLRQAERTEPGR